jgi:hypothetical protein
MFHLDHGAFTDQPAGPAGNRYVFLILAFDEDDETSRQIEFVLPETLARHLGQALTSGALGAARNFDSPSDCSE